MKQPSSPRSPFTINTDPPCEVERSLVSVILQNALWLIGIPACLFGLIDRGAVLFTDSSFLVTDVSYFLIACLLFASWLCFRPNNTPQMPSAESLSAHVPQKSDLPCVASQLHRLPFPYTCQIYHLLNLKHLEDIHSLSLGNLKVVEVSHLQPTQAGGRLKFKTALDSPFNVLRMWRQTNVEVELMLHTPYQVELKIPAYLDKKIAVVFSVLPLGDQEHFLLIQMYSDLRWPTTLLRGVLLLAASFTLLEDLPYLRQLAKRNLYRPAGTHSHGSMQLFQRYVDLYGTSGLEVAPAEILQTLQTLGGRDNSARPGPWWCNEFLQPLIVGSAQ